MVSLLSDSDRLNCFQKILLVPQLQSRQFSLTQKRRHIGARLRYVEGRKFFLQHVAELRRRELTLEVSALPQARLKMFQVHRRLAAKIPKVVVEILALHAVAEGPSF